MNANKYLIGSRKKKALVRHDKRERVVTVYTCI